MAGSRRARAHVLLAGAVLLLTAAGCTSGPPAPAPSEPPGATPQATGTGSTFPAPTAAGPTAAVPGGDVSYVAPGGDDNAAGARDDPWATLTHALTQLRPGQTLVVRGGTYREQVREEEISAGTPAAPITVTAAPGERVVVQGLLYLRRPSYWTLDGINVTWDAERNESDEHMVKVIDGVGWTWQNSELWGAASLSNILVVGDRRGEPADWVLRGNCIHDTIPANDENEDSNVYLGDMSDAGPGVVERNLIFGAPNGRNIKIGPGNSKPTDGPTGVTVRFNTLYSAAVPIVVSGGATDILIERNILGAGASGFLIRGYKLAGANVEARDNLGFDAQRFFAPDSGTLSTPVGNRLLNRSPLDAVGSCSAFAPVAGVAGGYGHRAATP